MKHGLRGAVGGRDMQALMAGLAGVPGVHGLKAPTLVAQALGHLAPVAGQYAAVQTRLGPDVGTGLSLGPARRFRHMLCV